MFTLDQFHRLNSGDIEKAKNVYARSYLTTTLYQKSLENVEDKISLLESFFEVAIRFGMKYGYAYAPTEKLEGIAIWIPGEKAKMNMWRILRSGGFLTIGKLMKSGKDILNSMKGMSRLDEDRHKHMEGKQYLHLMNLAVDPDRQQSGVGSKLLGAMFVNTDLHGYSRYVSADIDNVHFYEKQGFRTIQKLTIAVNGADLPNWEMVRSPHKI